MPTITISDTIFFSQTAISILVISNRNSFRVLFDKVLPYLLFEKYIFILALEVASPVNQHCANCIGTLSFPMMMMIEFVLKAVYWNACYYIIRQFTSFAKLNHDGFFAVGNTDSIFDSIIDKEGFLSVLSRQNQRDFIVHCSHVWRAYVSIAEADRCCTGR